MAGIPLLIWKIFSTGCVYSSPLCQVSNNQPCSFIVILLLHRDKRTALKTYFRLNTVVVHKQKWNYLHMYKAVYKCSKSQKYLEHSTLMLMNFICAIGLTTRVRGTNKIHHAFQPWACHTLHVKRCNPLWFAKVNDKVWRQVTAIRFPCLSVAFHSSPVGFSAFAASVASLIETELFFSFRGTVKAKIHPKNSYVLIILIHISSLRSSN